MIKKLILGRDICNIILHSMIYYAVILYLFSILDGFNLNYFTPCICCIFITLSYLNNKYSKNLFIFTLINVIAFIILFLYPFEFNVKVLLIIVLSLITINSFIIWGVRKKKSYINTPSVFGELFFIFCFMLSSSNKVSNIIFILGIIFILLNYFTNYISNIISFIYYNSNSKNLKIGEILNVNNYYISFFYVANIILIAIAKIFKLDYIFEKLLYPFFLLIQKIFQHIFNIHKTHTYPKIKAAKNAIKSTTTDNNPNLLIKIIDELVKIGLTLVKFLIILFVIYIIYKFIQLLISIFKNSENSIDEVECIENTNNKRSVFSYLFNFNTMNFDNNNNGKIRKIYYKKILKLKKHMTIFNDTLTPEEIQKQININNNSIDNLTKLYEKARYSNLKCTDDDVNNANNSLKR